MEDFVTFEIAKKLKEKGFPQRPDYFNYSSYYDWDGLRKIHSLSNASVWFDPNISRDNIYFAPIISQVLKWLREEKNIHMEIFLYNGKYSYFVKSITQICKDDLFHKCLNEDTTDEEYDIYEQAALAGIKYVLDNLI
jgi:hypothetical protein